MYQTSNLIITLVEPQLDVLEGNGIEDYELVGLGPSSG